MFKESNFNSLLAIYLILFFCQKQKKFDINLKRCKKLTVTGGKVKIIDQKKKTKRTEDNYNVRLKEKRCSFNNVFFCSLLFSYKKKYIHMWLFYRKI